VLCDGLGVESILLINRALCIRAAGAEVV